MQLFFIFIIIIFILKSSVFPIKSLSTDTEGLTLEIYQDFKCIKTE